MHKILTGALKVDHLDIPIAGLSSTLEGTTIVQLSDLHYDGVRLSETLLQQAIAASNQADPDLVVITGDFVTDDPAPIHDLAQRLKHLQSRAGIYAVLGNHDLHRRGSKATIIKALSKVDIHVLWNQVAYPLGSELAIVGLPDLWTGDFKASTVLDQVPETIPRIVLAHNPDSADYLQKWRVDLQLSGHTHGGQIILPGVGNISALSAQLYRQLPKRTRQRIPFLKACYRVVKNWDWSKGLYPVGDRFLYVNRGLGTYAPGRLFCPPEVTVIRLAKA